MQWASQPIGGPRRERPDPTAAGRCVQSANALGAIEPGEAPRVASRWEAAHREQRRAAAARVRAEHPDKSREYHAKYRAEHLDAVRAAAARWRLDHPDRVKEYQARWKAKHPKPPAAPRQGRSHSAETRAKMSLAAQARASKARREAIRRERDARIAAELDPAETTARATAVASSSWYSGIASDRHDGR